MATAKTTRPKRKHIDLDAGTRELAYPDGLLLTMGGTDFELPPELPIDVFDPFLSEDLDVVWLIRKFYGDFMASNVTTADVVFGIFEERPDLHKQILAALREGLGLLMGPEQYDAFLATRPSVQGIIRFVSALMDEYGAELGELFASPTSSESDGATQKETSNDTTASTSDEPDSPTTTQD